MISNNFSHLNNAFTLVSLLQLVYIGHNKAEQDSRVLHKTLARLCKNSKSPNSLIIEQHCCFYICMSREVKKLNHDVERL